MNLKIKIFIFLIFLITIRGFSQKSIDITLNSDEKYEKEILLKMVRGERDTRDIKGSRIKRDRDEEMKLPMILNWDKTNRLITLTFKKYDERGNEFIYLFPNEWYYKEVKKKDNKVWFGKKLNKNTTEKRIVKQGIDTKKLIHLKLEDENDVIKKLEVKDPDSELSFNFRESPARKEGICKISMNLYVGSKIPKNDQSSREIELEYLAELTLNITLKDICYDYDVTGFSSEIQTLQNEKDDIVKEMNVLNLYNCTILLEDKEITKKSYGEEPEKNGVDKQYEKYANCDNLKKLMESYNQALIAKNNAITEYNKKLDELKQDCLKEKQKQKQISKPKEEEKEEEKEINCNKLSGVNDMLAKLRFNISKQIYGQPLTDAQRDSHYRTYQRIIKDYKDKDSGYQNCSKYYEAFEEWCKAIEDLLKK